MVHEYQDTTKLDVKNTYHKTKETAIKVARILEEKGFKIFTGIDGKKVCWSKKNDCWMVQYYRDEE